MLAEKFGAGAASQLLFVSSSTRLRWSPKLRNAPTYLQTLEWGPKGQMIAALNEPDLTLSPSPINPVMRDTCFDRIKALRSGARQACQGPRMRYAGILKVWSMI